MKDRALIGAVGEQFPEKGKQTEQGRQQRETAVGLNVGGGDDAQEIDQNMPLLRSGRNSVWTVQLEVERKGIEEIVDHEFTGSRMTEYLRRYRSRYVLVDSRFGIDPYAIGYEA